MKKVKFEGIGFNAADVVSRDIEAFVSLGMGLRWFRDKKPEEKKILLRKVYALCQKEMGVKKPSEDKTGAK